MVGKPNHARTNVNEGLEGIGGAPGAPYFLRLCDFSENLFRKMIK